MELSARDANALLDLVGSLLEATDAEALAAACRAGLARLVPADLYEFAVLAPGAGGGGCYLGTPGGYDRAEQEWALHRAAEHPVVAHVLRHGDRGPCRVSDLMPLEDWRRTRFYRHTNRRLRQDYEIGALLPGGSGDAAGLAGLAVSRQRRDFDAREQAILARLRGPLGLALGRLRRQAAGCSGPSPAALAAAFPALTGREAEVLHWLLQGKRDGEIAEILSIRPATATTHMRNLLAKLGVESRLAAAMLAVRRCR